MVKPVHRPVGSQVPLAKSVVLDLPGSLARATAPALRRGEVLDLAPDVHPADVAAGRGLERDVGAVAFGEHDGGKVSGSFRALATWLVFFLCMYLPGTPFGKRSRLTVPMMGHLSPTSG